jgi:hypothetical protein
MPQQRFQGVGLGLGDTIFANVISGVAVAIAVAIRGVVAAKRYTERREAGPSVT